MTAQPDFPTRPLKEYLDRQFGEGELSLRRAGGGQSNPTFFVTHGSRKLVLRKKPAGRILSGAHAVEREYRVLQALAGTAVPVPEVLLLCEDDSVLGTPFYLMREVEGRVLHDCSLRQVPEGERRAMYMEMAKVLARLHAVVPEEVGLADFGRPGNYFARQLARWSRQYRESPSERIPALDRVIAWLEANLPEDDARPVIAHGDFRLGNMLFHPERPEIVAVLDWELSTLGHPLADLGFCCMPWRTAPDEYGGILGLDLAGLGLPSEAEFVACYYEHAAPTAPLRPFHVVFALFRFSVIFVGIADRARSGTAASQEAARVGPLAVRFAERAEAAIRQPV